MEVAFDVGEGFADVGEADVVATADGGEDVCFDEVQERQELFFRIVEADKGGGAFWMTGDGVDSACDPAAEGFGGHAEVLRSFGG